LHHHGGKQHRVVRFELIFSARRLHIAIVRHNEFIFVARKVKPTKLEDRSSANGGRPARRERMRRGTRFPSEVWRWFGLWHGTGCSPGE
jgi:hypothetical protein